MLTMYQGITNSPNTYLDGDINSTQTTISVVDSSKLPSAPNQATIGTGEDAETITYAGKSSNDLTGCVRGFEGIAKSWSSNTSIGRYFTNYDYSTIVANLLEHINDDAEHGQFYRQAIINGGCQVAQDVAKTLSTTPQYGSVDMFSVKAGWYSWSRFHNTSNKFYSRNNRICFSNNRCNTYWFWCFIY